MRSPSRVGRGFTLVELIIVALMVSVLIALLAPALSKVVYSAKRTGSVANLRTHVAAVTAYCGEHREAFPYLTDPRATYSVLRCGGEARAVEFFHIGFHWHFALAEAYYNGACNSPSFWPPRTRPAYATYYYYSATCIARPEFWNPRTRVGPEQWAATRQSDVLFPSKKGVFWNRAAVPGITPEYPSGLPEAGFLDGSATIRPLPDFLAPYRNGEGPFPGSYFSGYGLPVLHTIDGLRGRDVR
jgi:prepilin-type N-terminal cleavage/methylation domain-containing protein